PYPSVDVFSFDPSAYVEPASTKPYMRYPERGQRQWGAHATLRLALLEPLRVSTGLRWSGYEFREHRQVLDGTGSVAGESRRQYSDHDLSPPYVAIEYGVGAAWSTYLSYTSIHKSQADSLDKSGEPLDPISGSNWEAGIKGALREDKLNVSLAVYR